MDAKNKSNTAVAVTLVLAIAFAFFALTKNKAPENIIDDTKTSDLKASQQAVLGSTDTGSLRVKRITILDTDSNPVFTDVAEDQLNHADLEEFLAKRHIGAYRIVHADSDTLRAQIRASNEQPRFKLVLLDNNSISLVARDATEYSSGWQTGIGTWAGQVENDETSRATFVVGSDGSVNGVVRSLKTGRIKIEPIKGTPHHIVWQLGADFEKSID